MKKIRTIICLFAIVIALDSCKRVFSESFNTYFWTSTEGESVFLYIDGENKGQVPYLASAPDCDNEASKEDALKIHLPSSTYTIELRDELGESLFSEDLHIWKRGGSIELGTTTAGDGSGGSRRSFKGRCLIEELFYTKR